MILSLIGWPHSSPWVGEVSSTKHTCRLHNLQSNNIISLRKIVVPSRNKKVEAHTDLDQWPWWRQSYWSSSSSGSSPGIDSRGSWPPKHGRSECQGWSRALPFRSRCSQPENRRTRCCPSELYHWLKVWPRTMFSGMTRIRAVNLG